MTAAFCAAAWVNRSVACFPREPAALMFSDSCEEEGAWLVHAGLSVTRAGVKRIGAPSGTSVLACETGFCLEANGIPGLV